MKSTWTIKDKQELLLAIDRKIEIHERKHWTLYQQYYAENQAYDAKPWYKKLFAVKHDDSASTLDSTDLVWAIREQYDTIQALTTLKHRVEYSFSSGASTCTLSDKEAQQVFI